jgi:amino acid transporter
VIVAHTQNAAASLVIWVVAALLAWTGAGSFAELGASLPQNGGTQAYLAYTYGPLVSYLFTWTTISLLSPGEFPNIYHSAVHFGYGAFFFFSCLLG